MCIYFLIYTFLLRYFSWGNLVDYGAKFRSKSLQCEHITVIMMIVMHVNALVEDSNPQPPCCELTTATTEAVVADRKRANCHGESERIHTEPLCLHPECHQDLEITTENQLGSVMRSGRPGSRCCSQVQIGCWSRGGQLLDSSADCPWQRSAALSKHLTPNNRTTDCKWSLHGELCCSLLCHHCGGVKTFKEIICVLFDFICEIV